MSMIFVDHGTYCVVDSPNWEYYIDNMVLIGAMRNAQFVVVVRSFDDPSDLSTAFHFLMENPDEFIRLSEKGGGSVVKVVELDDSHQQIHG